MNDAFVWMVAAVCGGAAGAAIINWLVREWDEYQWKKRMKEILNEYDFDNLDVVSMSEVIEQHRKGRDSE